MFSCEHSYSRTGSVCSTLRIVRMSGFARHGTAVDRLLIRQTGLSAARRGGARSVVADPTLSKDGPGAHVSPSTWAASLALIHQAGRNKPSPSLSLPSAARRIVSTSFITVLTPSNKNGGVSRWVITAVAPETYIVMAFLDYWTRIRDARIECETAGMFAGGILKTKNLWNRNSLKKRIHTKWPILLRRPRVTLLNYPTIKVTLLRKPLTLSSVKTVSPFKYDIKLFHFDQSHGIFRKILNNINNVRHILFCVRVPMRLNMLAYQNTHTHTTTTYDVDKPKYRTGAGSRNNKILNTIVGRSILISNFKDSATKQLALIWFRHAVASTSVAQHGARSIISVLYRARTTDRADKVRGDLDWWQDYQQRPDPTLRLRIRVVIALLDKIVHYHCIMSSKKLKTMLDCNTAT